MGVLCWNGKEILLLTQVKLFIAALGCRAGAAHDVGGIERGGRHYSTLERQGRVVVLIVTEADGDQLIGRWHLHRRPDPWQGAPRQTREAEHRQEVLGCGCVRAVAAFDDEDDIPRRPKVAHSDPHGNVC